MLAGLGPSSQARTSARRSGLAPYPQLCTRHPYPTTEFLDDAVMRNGLTNKGWSVRHVEHILGCTGRRVNEADLADVLRVSSKLRPLS